MDFLTGGKERMGCHMLKIARQNLLCEKNNLLNLLQNLLNNLWKHMEKVQKLHKPPICSHSSDALCSWILYTQQFSSRDAGICLYHHTYTMNSTHILMNNLKCSSCMWLARAGFMLAYTDMLQDLKTEFLKYNNRFKAIYFCLWKEWPQDSLEYNVRALFLF